MTPSPEAGFALIEVLISGVLACVAALGIATVMQTSVHTASDQRDRSQAFALAQEDQARLRALRIPSLRNLTTEEKERPVTIDGLKYTVTSSAAFINNSSEGSPSCASGSNSADYLTITSKVEWPNMAPIPPVTLSSIVAPPIGTLAPNSGMLAINISNQSGTGISGVGLSGTGAGTFSGTTEGAGCAIFLEQTAGKYTLTFSGGATSLVDQDGVTPTTKEITVNAETTTSIPYTFGTPGSIKLNFKTTNYKNETVNAELEKLTGYNSGMLTGAKVLTFSPKKTSYEWTSLFPFTSKDSFYSPSCVTNVPSIESPSLVSVVIPAGGKTEQTLTMPALLLTVKKSSTSTGAVATNGITVKVTDNNCTGVSKTFTTATVSGGEGRISEPMLPWSNYTVCAWTPIKKENVTENYYESFTSDVKVATTKTIELTTADSHKSTTPC